MVCSLKSQLSFYVFCRKQTTAANNGEPSAPSSPKLAETGQVQLQTKTKFTIEQIRGAVELIVNEFSFLVERRLKKRIANMPAEEQILYMADAILPALALRIKTTLSNSFLCSTSRCSD